MASFNSSVWDAANTGDLHALVTALASYPHFIDTPHPHKLRRTPIYIAAKKGYVTIIEKLIELGSKAIDTPTMLGFTPMHTAAINGHIQVIETLVRLGSMAIGIPAISGWTPIHVAAYDGVVQVIETIVRLNTAIDTPDDIGRTPLCLAAYYNHTDIVKTLKMLGADCSIVQRDGIPDSLLTLLNTQVDEDESAEVRYRVYFSQSLIVRTLEELEVRHNQKATKNAQTRFN